MSNMFQNLAGAVQPKKKSTSKKTMNLPRTTEFVAKLAEAGLRLSYAALANASEALGEHEATGLSAGQRGSIIVSALPETLQPFVCRGNGSYARGTEWPNVEVPKNLRELPYIRPETILSYVSAFEEATSEPSEETEAEEVEIEVTA